jgi:hypothetical protein
VKCATAGAGTPYYEKSCKGKMIDDCIVTIAAADNPAPDWDKIKQERWFDRLSRMIIYGQKRPSEPENQTSIEHIR